MRATKLVCSLIFLALFHAATSDFVIFPTIGKFGKQPVPTLFPAASPGTITQPLVWGNSFSLTFGKPPESTVEHGTNQFNFTSQWNNTQFTVTFTSDPPGAFSYSPASLIFKVKDESAHLLDSQSSSLSSQIVDSGIDGPIFEDI